MDYDFILKFENLKTEQDLMLEMLSLKDTIYLHNVHQNSRNLSKNEKLKYFQMLSNEDLNQLTNIYQQDFDLFDYDPQIYKI